LPYGRKRALEIATTLSLDPVMLLLDEPMAGLGQQDIGLISALIRKVAPDRTVLMVEHNLSVVADLSDIITVLTPRPYSRRGRLRRCLAEPRGHGGVSGEQPCLMRRTTTLRAIMGIRVAAAGLGRLSRQ
jgi:branched-chain amino acid transport system ATP-binding protein